MHRPKEGIPMTDPFDGACPVRWMIDDIGRYLAGEDAASAEIGSAGRQAVTRAASEVDDLLRSAFAAHEVVATELRFAGPARGFRGPCSPCHPPRSRSCCCACA